MLLCFREKKMEARDLTTLKEAIEAMEEKIREQIPLYKDMPLAQEVTVGTGETMLRQNPATVEFRATVRDYGAALKILKDLEEGKPEEEIGGQLADLKAKFKLAK